MLQALYEVWEVVALMAPYLLLGFLIAGVLSEVLSKDWVEKYLGVKGVAGVVRATIVGIPLPLCSCGVLPVAASLKERGAGKGATASFLTATPQTGVDSVLATYGLMGPVFTLWRLAAAFITGFLTGFLVDLTEKEETQKSVETSCCGGGKETSCCGGANVEKPSLYQKIGGGLYYGFVKMPQDIGVTLLVGLLVAGIVSTLMPEELFNGWRPPQFLEFAAVSLLAVPLYVCSTGSIPLAFVLMEAGLSPGAALVMLISGPATNIAALATISQLIGVRGLVVFVLSLVLMSWGIGYGFNIVNDFTLMLEDSHHHEEALTVWYHTSGVILLMILAYALVVKHWPKTEKKSCCAG